MTSGEWAYPARLEDAGKLALRATIGGLMLFHGVHKLLHGVGGVGAALAQGGFPAAMAPGVYLSEVVAPILIIIGLWTRPAAVLYALTVLFASLLVHGREFTRLADTGGWAAELYVFYTAGAVAVALLGAGRYSVRSGRGTWTDALSLRSMQGSLRRLAAVTALPNETHGRKE